MAANESQKRVAISKANAQMIGMVSAAAFVAVFCLVSANALFGQIRYQAKLTKEKQVAHKQLEDNIKAVESLKTAFSTFDNQPVNVINGNRDGRSDNDGRNSKIILDALPSSYDFPALASSIEKIVKTQNMKVKEISGTDDQVNQEAVKASPTPKQVEMPFAFTVDGVDYAGANRLVDVLQKSIRPIQIDELNLSGSSSSLTVTIKARTFYQPGKNVSVTKKVVK